MKYFTNDSTLKFTWDQVAAGFWQRYPNPQSAHVLSEDVVSRQVNGNKLFSHRLLTKTNKMPKWGERFMLGPKQVCIVEESVVDPVAKTLVTYTRNIGFSRTLSVEEKCTYRPADDNSGWTICERQAWISSGLYGFSYAIQAFAYDRFKKNASKAIQGFEYVLNKMYMPGIVSLPDNSKSILALPATAIDPSKLAVNKEKIKSTAIKAKEMAKSKAAPVVASVTSGASPS